MYNLAALSNCLFSKAISKALYFRYLVANSLGNLQSVILFKAHTKESYIGFLLNVYPIYSYALSSPHGVDIGTVEGSTKKNKGVLLTLKLISSVFKTISFLLPSTAIEIAFALGPVLDTVSIVSINSLFI